LSALKEPNISFTFIYVSNVAKLSPSSIFCGYSNTELRELTDNACLKICAVPYRYTVSLSRSRNKNEGKWSRIALMLKRRGRLCGSNLRQVSGWSARFRSTEKKAGISNTCNAGKKADMMMLVLPMCDEMPESRDRGVIS
jgi:hypothetical protein